MEHGKSFEVPATVAEKDGEAGAFYKGEGEDFAMFELFDSRAKGTGAQGA